MDEIKDLDVVSVTIAEDGNEDLTVVDFYKLYNNHADQEKVFIDVKSLYNREDYINEEIIFEENSELLITRGGIGFIDSNLCKKLLAKGYEA